MSYEASIKINCEGFSTRIKDFVSIMDKLKWSVYNDRGYINYFPIGDDGSNGLKADKLSKEQILNIIDLKQDKNELVGIDLCFNREDLGITLLANDTTDITLAIDINRKEYPDRTTDFVWYYENIIVALRNNGCCIDSLKFEEYIC